ncbi:MAG: hypothetical protein ACLRWA_02285 [Lachnospira sp.]
MGGLPGGRLTKAQAYKEVQGMPGRWLLPRAVVCEAAKNYAAQCKQDRTEDKYIKHGKTFLGESTPFLDYLPKEKPAQSEAEYDDNENPFGSE